jgi:hypothetical protein
VRWNRWLWLGLGLGLVATAAGAVTFSPPARAGVCWALSSMVTPPHRAGVDLQR